jgi:dihydrofolate synthase/folylpolyglutamate synthase
VPDDFAGSIGRGTVAELFPSKGICSLDVPSDHPIVVTGSIYLIGEIWERFLEDTPVGQGVLQDF